MIPIALTLLLVAAPQQPAPRQAPTAAPTSPARPQQAAPARPAPPTAPESTVAAITDIGTRVAEAKNAYDVFRRSAFNDPNGKVLERAEVFRTSCRQMAEAADRGQRMLCRACFPAAVQASVDRYREVLPSLGRTGRQCASRVQQLRAGVTPDTAALRLRRDVRPMGERLVTGVRPYEARLEEVRRQFGWAQPVMVPTPRR
jgi:hypothetical protein